MIRTKNMIYKTRKKSKGIFDNKIRADEKQGAGLISIYSRWVSVNGKIEITVCDFNDYDDGIRGLRDLLKNREN